MIASRPWSSIAWVALAAICCTTKAHLWHGRSIYFVVTDRFAKSEGDLGPSCAGREWCGGTLRGVERKLGYIRNMGFDAVWITPVVKQVAWRDSWNGTGYHGYWAADFSQIDPHLGSEEDLLALRRACEARSMLLMLDVVANHVGPVRSLRDVERLGPPFNDPSGDQFHQLHRRADQTLESYVHRPANSLSAPGCWPMYGPGCDMTTVQQGWFGDLADLRQEHEQTRAFLLVWLRQMVEKYGLDGIRLDTALYMPLWFLDQLQQAAGVYITGEVVTHNTTFHRSFSPALQGLLNFPVTTSLVQAFGLGGSLLELRDRLDRQRAADYADEHLLGNFIDNHDGPRFLRSQRGDECRLRNGLVWTMLHHGIPIVYYGTEQRAVSDRDDERTSMWPHYGQTRLYRFIARVNRLRANFGLAAGGRYVTERAAVVKARRDLLAFVRGELLAVVGNACSGGRPARVCLALSALPRRWSRACARGGVRRVLGSRAAATCRRGRLCLHLGDGEPAVFALTREWVTVVV